MANSPYFTPKSTIARWDRQRAVVLGLYQLFEVNKEYDTSIEKVTQALDAKRGDVEKASATATKVGLLTRETRALGQRDIHSYWKLVMPKEGAIRALDAYWQDEEEERLASHRGGEREVVIRERVAAALQEKVVVTEAPAENGTAAIAGPDAPSPFADLAPLRKDEPAALVEAARQYQNRSKLVAEAQERFMAVLSDAGVSIDPSTINVTYERDERLETIALVLPRITELEGRVERLTKERNEVKSRNDEYRIMKETISKQRQQIDRLIAERDTLRRGHLS